MSKYKTNIIATGRYVPEKILTNDDLSKMVDTSDEWIYTRTGIKTRHITEGTVLNMAYHAAVDVINKAKIDKNEIDLIVVATITAEQKTPSIANMVQKMLEIENNHVMSFDINAACTGFVYALEIAASLVHTNFNKALVIGVEKMTNVVDFTDRNTCVLFGDGAGAMLIEKGNDDIFFYNDSNGDLSNLLTVDSDIKMDGRKVYLFAVDIIPKAIYRILEENNLTLDDIDYIIPHQANVRIIDAFVKTIGFDRNKVLINIDRYGNTSAASIPIAVDEYKDKNKDERKNVLLVGFGGGFTWGASIIKI